MRIVELLKMMSLNGLLAASSANAFLEMILSNVEWEPNTGCLLWTRWCGKNNRARVWYKSRRWATTRAIYDALVGPLPREIYLCHRCDTPACVNPDHLFLGTNKDNQLDFVRKGRKRRESTRRKPIDANARRYVFPVRRGEECITAKANDEMVREIRRKSALGIGYRKLSKEFGLARSTIQHIVHGRTWKHVG